MENSEISWTDHTYNPWIGCTEVGPGCDHCYARLLMQNRHGRVRWGSGELRSRTKTHSDVRRWNRQAAESGRRPRVFVASLADVFDNEVPDEWRTDLWRLMEETEFLRWMPLTKRIGNVVKMVPQAWIEGRWPAHVGIMATMVNQEEWDRDIGKLMAVPAPWRGVSCEPMLGTIRVRGGCPDWIITGGESGENRRPFDIVWACTMQRDCERHGIAYHHKQNGGLRGKDGGCLIDGVEHKHFPPALAA